MAGYGPPPGPYVGFQPSVQPIGFEMHQPGYPPGDSRPSYPPPPSQDIYHPSTNDYNTFASPAAPSGPSYHHHGDENGDNLPPVGFEGIGNRNDQDSATTSGVKLLDRESPVPPILSQRSDVESHQINVKPSQVCIIILTSLHAVLFEMRFVLFLRLVSSLFGKWC